MKGTSVALAGLLAQQASAFALPRTPKSGAHAAAMNRTAPHMGSKAQAVTQDASSPVYYIAWFFPPSGSIVTNFVSTMSVPGLSPVPSLGPRYVWPGMENAATDFVFQDVLGDNQPQGQWTFATWYVGEGQDQEYPIHNVTPGDTTTSTFNSADGGGINWSESFSVNGADGTTGGVDSVSFDSEGAMVNALFAIELWDNAQWDFGSITWSDISITAITTDTNWCTNPSFQAPSGVSDFSYTISPPNAQVNGNTVTCTVDSIVFNSP